MRFKMISSVIRGNEQKDIKKKKKKPQTMRVQKCNLSIKRHIFTEK